MHPRTISKLASIVGQRHVTVPVPDGLLHDATQQQVRAAAGAAVFPRSAKQVSEVVAYCYRANLAMQVRGGGTGLAAGAVPRRGSVLICLDRLNRVRQFSPEQWRMQVEAGVITAEVNRVAGEAGLLYPPDPGAARHSQIGGNIATNAGGAHTFKHGVTGHWVTGLEVVTATGEILQLGGPLRKDVAPYDLKSLFIGSEGTLGIITAAWLKLAPKPEASLPVVATFPTATAGMRAMQRLFTTAQQPTAVELLDRETLRLAAAGYPGTLPATAGFMLILEAEGDRVAARETQRRLTATLHESSLDVYSPTSPAAIGRLWNWRYGIYNVVAAQHGGMVSEDIGVPIDKLLAAIEGVYRIGRRNRLAVCNWGHAGDGNIHATFLADPTDRQQRIRVERAIGQLFDLALSLGGTISGEHGVGRIKRPWLARQSGASHRYQRQVKRLFDPKGLFNPGVKV